MAKDNHGKPHLGDRLKVVRPVIVSNSIGKIAHNVMEKEGRNGRPDQTRSNKFTEGGVCTRERADDVPRLIFKPALVAHR